LCDYKRPLKFFVFCLSQADQNEAIKTIDMSARFSEAVGACYLISFAAGVCFLEHRRAGYGNLPLAFFQKGDIRIRPYYYARLKGVFDDFNFLITGSLKLPNRLQWI
jgi:hypothetical protein